MQPLRGHDMLEGVLLQPVRVMAQVVQYRRGYVGAFLQNFHSPGETEAEVEITAALGSGPFHPVLLQFPRRRNQS